MILSVPAQSVLLELCEEDGRWMGTMQIEGQDFRVEAYALNSPDPTVQHLIADLTTLAECGDALAETTIDGQQCVLVVMPKGM